MDGQLAAVHIICFIAQQIEKLGVDHADEEVEGGIRVRHDEEQRRFLITQRVQLQLIVHCEVTQFLDVEGCKPGTAGNQDGFCGLSGSQLVKFVLPPGKAVGLLFCQFFKQQIHRVLVFLVILQHLHGVQHFQQGSKVLFLGRGFIMQIGDQGGQQKTFTFLPEGVPAGPFALGVGHQGRNQLQNVLFAVDIGEGIVVHQLVTVLQHCVATFKNDSSFRIGDDIGAVALKQIRFQPKPRLTAAGTAHYQHVFVSGVLGVRRAVGHHQPFCFSQDDVVGKLRSHERLNVLGIAPPGRAVLHAMAVLFGVFSTQIDGKAQPCAAAQAHQQIQRMQAWQRVCKCHRDGAHHGHDLIAQFLALSKPPRFTEVRCHQSQQNIGQIQRQQLCQLFRGHNPRSCSLCRTLPGSSAAACTSSCNRASTEGLLSLFSRDAEYSLNAE